MKKIKIKQVFHFFKVMAAIKIKIPIIIAPIPTTYGYISSGLNNRHRPDTANNIPTANKIICIVLLGKNIGLKFIFTAKYSH